MNPARKIRAFLLAAILCIAGITLAACALYQDDRMYISDEKYEQARRIYDRTDSLLLTEQRLRELHWQRAEINEALYRLKKQHRLE